MRRGQRRSHAVSSLFRPRMIRRPITEQPILRQPRHHARHRVRRGLRGGIR
jgi:hypothetical protein